MAQQPLTQRALRKIRESQPDEEFVVIYNSSKQLINVQVVRRPKPGQKKLDFYFAQQTVALQPKATVKLPKAELLMHQLRNLQAKGYLKILSEDTKM
ncbi:MAG: hypothetical protein Q8K86_00275 [Candidatus Nanopelagicaceae bacterium]|nr:hypothetical protein [Candidatus Nanopelagicaceae bacterium]